MKLPRAIVRSLCRLLAAAVVFAQLMVAAYACPGLTGPADGFSASTAEASAMPAGCDEMDRDSAALCSEHCRFGQQSADTAQPPSVQPALPLLLYLLPPAALPAAGTGAFPAPAAQLAAAPPPPHAILHCVLRI